MMQELCQLSYRFFILYNDVRRQSQASVTKPFVHGPCKSDVSNKKSAIKKTVECDKKKIIHFP